LLLRDGEHPQDRRAEQPGRRKAGGESFDARTMAPVRPGLRRDSAPDRTVPLRMTITLISNFNN
jgi:hypothetical protein